MGILKYCQHQGNKIRKIERKRSFSTEKEQKWKKKFWILLFQIIFGAVLPFPKKSLFRGALPYRDRI